MENFFQFVAVLLDFSLACCLLYALLSLTANFIKQSYIRMRCKYRGFKEKPGRACVICDYQHQCDRVRQSAEYRQYFHDSVYSPEQAKELFDKVLEEEEAKRADEKPK